MKYLAYHLYTPRNSGAYRIDLLIYNEKGIIERCIKVHKYFSNAEQRTAYLWKRIRHFRHKDGVTAFLGEFHHTYAAISSKQYNAPLFYLKQDKHAYYTETVRSNTEEAT